MTLRWAGSDNNPRNNDGEGPAGEDRNNVVLLAAPRVQKSDPDYSEYGDLTRSYPEHLDNATFLGFTRSDLVNLALARGGLWIKRGLKQRKLMKVQEKGFIVCKVFLNYFFMNFLYGLWFMIFDIVKSILLCIIWPKARIYSETTPSEYIFF